jgi:hypothetical protein
LVAGIAPITPGAGLSVAVDLIVENLSGTVAKAATTALVGVGTAFLSELVVGGVVRVPGATTEDRIVSAITSDTALTVSVAFTATASGQTAQRVREVQLLKLVDGTPGSVVPAVVSAAGALTVDGSAATQPVRSIAPSPTTIALTGPSNGTWGTNIDCRGYQWIVVRVQSVGGSPTVGAYGSDRSGGTFDQTLQWTTPDSINGTSSSRFFQPAAGVRFTYITTPPPFLEIGAIFGGSGAAVVAYVDLYPFPGPTVQTVTGDPKSYLLDMHSGSPAALIGTYSIPGSPGRVFTAPSTPAIALLSAVAATGAGAAKDFDCGFANHGFQVVLTGSPVLAVVALQGSLDGTNWVTLGTWDKAVRASGDIVFVSGKPVSRVRANVTTLSGGTAPTVTATWTATAAGAPDVDTREAGLYVPQRSRSRAVDTMHALFVEDFRAPTPGMWNDGVGSSSRDTDIWFAGAPTLRLDPQGQTNGSATSPGRTANTGGVIVKRRVHDGFTGLFGLECWFRFTSTNLVSNTLFSMSIYNRDGASAWHGRLWLDPNGNNVPMLGKILDGAATAAANPGTPLTGTTAVYTTVATSLLQNGAGSHQYEPSAAGGRMDKAGGWHYCKLVVNLATKTYVSVKLDGEPTVDLSAYALDQITSTGFAGMHFSFELSASTSTRPRYINVAGIRGFGD